MKKSDLKCGQVVELRCGDMGIYFEESIMLYKEGYLGKDSIDENMNCVRTEDYDIMKVFNRKTHTTAKGIFDKRYVDMNLIWERKEIPKLTQTEIVLLEALPKYYKYISRDRTGELSASTSKPKKYEIGWDTVGHDESSEFLIYDHLFKFIKWEDEEPWNIAELIAWQK